MVSDSIGRPNNPKLTPSIWTSGVKGKEKLEAGVGKLTSENEAVEAAVNVGPVFDELDDLVELVAESLVG